MDPALKSAPKPHALRLPPDAPYRRLVGVGGIGSGMFFALEGDHLEAQAVDTSDVGLYPYALEGAVEELVQDDR